MVHVYHQPELLADVVDIGAGAGVVEKVIFEYLDAVKPSICDCLKLVDQRAGETDRRDGGFVWYGNRGLEDEIHGEVGLIDARRWEEKIWGKYGEGLGVRQCSQVSVLPQLGVVQV